MEESQEVKSAKQVEHENYIRLHNTIIGIYWDLVNHDISKTDIEYRLKEAVEISAGISFEEAQELLKEV